MGEGVCWRHLCSQILQVRVSLGSRGSGKDGMVVCIELSLPSHTGEAEVPYRSPPSAFVRLPVSWRVGQHVLHLLAVSGSGCPTVFAQCILPLAAGLRPREVAAVQVLGAMEEVG